MAKRDQIGGALGGHDAGKAGDAKNVALLGAAFGDQRKGFGRHADLAFGHGGAGGHRFGGNVDHMGVAAFIEVGEGHVPPCDVSGLARMARVAAATSCWRIRLSPIRKQRAP